jgi:hypothetical protein
MAKLSSEIILRFDAEVDVTTQEDTEIQPLFEVPDVVDKDGTVEEEQDDYEEHGGCRCIYCKRVVDPSSNEAYSEVLTWLRGKNKDSSTLRTYTGRISCAECVRKLRSGISPTQNDLEESVEAMPKAGEIIQESFTDQSEHYTAGWNDGYNDVSLPTDRMMPSQYLQGYADGKDKQEQDRWK